MPAPCEPSRAYNVKVRGLRGPCRHDCLQSRGDPGVLMTVLNIRHRTTYRYREPVKLGAHRLMLRPRESRDVRLLSSTLEITPAASLSWTTDVFGNAVATAGFAGLADGLTIESRVVVELGASP